MQRFVCAANKGLERRSVRYGSLFLLPFPRNTPTRLDEAQAFCRTCTARPKRETAARKVSPARSQCLPAAVQKRQILRFATNFGPQGRTAAATPSGCGSPIGRGHMARRRIERNAIELNDCRFATLQLPAMTTYTGAPKAELPRAPTPKPYASHSAISGRPFPRLRLGGARVRGVHNGYQENAGGCHPPGRNTDYRHSG